MIKTWAKIAILFVAASAALIYLSQLNMLNRNTDEKQFLDIRISNVKIKAELADTPEKRALGLSGRETLGNDEGMLFVFDEPNTRQFWMKNMNFALDIIWIDENKKVIDVTKNVLPESYPKKFQPHEPAKYVLEVNASFADAHNIKIGDSADFRD